MSGSGFGASATSPSTSPGHSRRRAGSAGALAFAAAASLFAADRPSLPAIVEQFDHLTIGKPMVVGPLTLSSEHMQCKLLSGNAAPVLAGDEVVGIFFEGTGTMDYLSADPLEASTVVFTAKKGSSLKPEKTDKGVRLRDNFRRVLWLAQGQPLPALAGTAYVG